jgi:hypothetical protein
MSETLRLDQIEPDPVTQPRAAMNVPLVAEYIEAMREGTEFPPVTVFHDGQRYWMGDGHHRVFAARSLRREDIHADIRQGDREDAILFAAGANAKHGQRRTNEDKRRAVAMALALPRLAGKSDREIAAVCTVSHTFVASVRKGLSGNGCQMPEEREVTRGGSTYAMDTTGINARRQKQEPEAEVAEEPAELPEGEQEAEPDDTEFVRDHIAAAFELVTYYRDYKEVDVAELIDPKRRKAIARKAKRLGNWLKNLGWHLERGAP